MEKFIVETSARHIHLTEETFKKLFGEEEQLTVKAYLSQPGQFASNSKLDIVGPKRTIEKVSILGPFRKDNQVEVSLTDVRTLGVSAPIRESGDIASSPSITLRGPKGEVVLDSGLIVAKRHIHMTNADSKNFNVKNGDIVKVLIDSGNGRKTIFDDTVVRVRDDFSLAMHIDTDESNAAGCGKEVFGVLVK